jgi:hypothetical protein
MAEANYQFAVFGEWKVTWSWAQKALRLQKIRRSDHDEPFAAIIFCTADCRKVGRRTRSKWSRVRRYAMEHKSKAEPLATFIRREGGRE